MSVPKIPTLHLGPTQIIQDKKDIAAYIVRHALNNPGGTSSFVEHELVSFRKLEAEFGENGQLLAKELEGKLNAILYKYFGDDSFMTEVEYEQYDSSSKYKLAINITDASGVPLISNTSISLNNRKISINYTPE